MVVFLCVVHGFMYFCVWPVLILCMVFRMSCMFVLFVVWCSCILVCPDFAHAFLYVLYGIVMFRMVFCILCMACFSFELLSVFVVCLFYVLHGFLYFV